MIEKAIYDKTLLSIEYVNAEQLVTEDDVADLLTCYSDTNTRPIFNSDTCTSNFFYDTSDEMSDCIKMWLNSYVRKDMVHIVALLNYAF